jgi:hypothetical protein
MAHEGRTWVPKTLRNYNFFYYLRQSAGILTKLETHTVLSWGRIMRKTTRSTEVYTVKIDRDDATGVAVFEEWTQGDGTQNRIDGPAMIVRDRSTGIVTTERWIRNNEIHRDDGPAVILRTSTGRVYSSEWFKHGEKIPAPRPSRGHQKRKAPPAAPRT